MAIDPDPKPSGMRQEVRRLILAEGYERRDAPFQLASGEWSRDYIDCRRALSGGASLRLVAEAIIAIAHERGATFDLVGGLTMGADPLAHAIAILAEKRWFSVRKEAKGHGKQNLIEGAPVGPSSRVLLVEDVVTTGGSILRALDAVQAARANVVLAVCVVDRGERAGAELAARGVAYEPVLTYGDLEIEPVGASTN